jgi:hypothetical protein
VKSCRTRIRHKRLGHAARAAAIAPQNFGYAAHYATLLAEAGRFEEAQIAFARVASMAPDHPVLLYKLTEFHERRGDLESAVEVAELLVAAHSETYRPRLESLRELKGKNAGWLNRLELAFRGRGIFAISPRPIDVRVTTTPSQPLSADAIRRHEGLMARRPLQPVDVMLVGDSLAEHWPAELWAPLSVFNFGAAAGGTQHLLWRLEQLPAGSIDCRHAVVLLGADRLGARDTARGIAAGVAAVVAALIRVAPRAKILVISAPSCGPVLRARKGQRRKLNAALARLGGFETLDFDEALIPWGADCVSSCQDGGARFTANVYRHLTAAVEARLKPNQSTAVQVAIPPAIGYGRPSVASERLPRA